MDNDFPELVDTTTVQRLNKSMYVRVPASFRKQLGVKPSKEAKIRTIGIDKVEITFL